MNLASIDTEDTITAIATPLGRSALGVVRISGRNCLPIVQRIFSPRSGKEVVPFRPTVGRILLQDTKFLDEAVVTIFQEPHSYTKENLAEIACHGNPLILDQVIGQVIGCGARLARPGEFTYRAFLNGRIDLVQAAAVDDLISADSLFQAELALQHLEGRLSNRLASLREKFVELISLMEGNIDFSEEQHYNFITAEEAMRRHDALVAEIQRLLGTFERGRIIREGFHVALVGRPNVGKSSIFNYLLGQDRAIVTPVPGTTRDYLDEKITLGGALVVLLDTAGIRESSEEVERQGIIRSRQVIAKADLIAFVLDGSVPLSEEDRRLWSEVVGKDAVVFCNKSDLPSFTLRQVESGTSSCIAVSAKTGSGMEQVMRELQQRVEDKIRLGSEDYAISNLRHRDLLRLCLDALHRSQETVRNGMTEEFALLDLHEALQHIGSITGEITIDDIYEQIFSRFCIGK